MTFVGRNCKLAAPSNDLTPSEALKRLTTGCYPTLKIEFDAAANALSCRMRPEGRPSFTPALLRDLSRMQRDISLATASAQPFRYLTVRSDIPKTFNLGGDLALFAAAIRSGDRQALRAYGHACADIVYHNAVGYGGRVITVALVQGAALGGGFEAALSCHHIVAERSATFSLPEVMFNLFPGMGAYSLLSRRLDAVRAEKLILSGKTYTAAELHEMGLVDVLAEDGEGDAALRRFLSDFDRRYNTHRAVLQARQRFNPLTREELTDIVDVWVDAAMKLEETDLLCMDRLVRTQNRRYAADNGVRQAE